MPSILKPSPSDPLSYAGLKAVVKHIDPNKRIEYALRIPSIRTADQQVPLRIHKLSFGHCRVSINDVEYSLGLIRIYPSDEGPPSIRKTTNYDVDEFGSVNSQTDPATPGDLVVKDDVQQREPPVEHIEQWIQSKEEFIAERIALNRQMGFMKLESEMTEKELQIEAKRFKKYRIRRKKIASYEESCRKMRKEITFYKYREQGILPEVRIQLNIKRPNGSENVEQVKYTKRLFEAEKCITNKIFGERAVPIIVNHLELDRSIDIMRLPLGMKLTVKNLDIQAVPELLNDAYFISMLTLTSLDTLRIQDNGFNPVNYEMDLVKDSKELIVEYIRNRSPQIYPNLDNPKITFVYYPLRSETVVDMIQGCQMSPRKIGTTWTFRKYRNSTCRILHLIKEQIDEAVVVERSLIIPISQTSELLVSHWEDPEDEDHFMLKMEVMAVGEAKQVAKQGRERKSRNNCCILL